MYTDQKLNEIMNEILSCHNCVLHKTRANAVPGEGNIGRQIMFIGEAPGYNEDVQGKPFVGQAGKLLNTLLTEADLSREDVFITNIVKCRPPNNREPSKQEVKMCTPYLESQIKAIKPKIIVALGNHSTRYIFEKFGLSFSGITSVHGKFFNVSTLDLQTTVFPTFHPAAGLYHGNYKKMLHEDFQLLKDKVKKYT